MPRKNTAVSPEGQSVTIGRIGDLSVVANQNAHPRAAASYYAVRLQRKDGQETAILLTAKELTRGLERARKNPEDVPTAGNLLDKLRDMLD